MTSLALLCAVTACALQLGAASALPQQHQPAPLPKPVAQLPAHPASADSGAEAFIELCSQGPDWIRYGDSCYRFNETSEYWYVAEQQCKSHKGHLVSIANKAENSFVAKLTYCKSAWTGRYAVNVDKLHESGNYRWTDGTHSNGTTYHAHDFSSITSIHEPLISVVNQKWENNVYHTKEQSYVCKVKTPGGGGGSGRCLPGWKYLNGSCYQMPAFSASYIEAMFHCSQYKSGFLVSVYSAQELRALSLIDLASDGCPPELWVGLIKVIDPSLCREMFSSGPGCYKWQDRKETLHNGFPAWHQGHPEASNVRKCVLLKDRAMKTVDCNDSHRFICKTPAA